MATAPRAPRKTATRQGPAKYRPSHRLFGKPAARQLLDEVNELFSLCTFVGHDYHLTTAKLTGYNRRVHASQEVMLFGCWECRRCGMTKRRTFRRRTKGA